MTMSDRIAVMNRGRYEQLGEPEALYERPTTRFVAGFLGVSNLLPGTVEGGDGHVRGRPTRRRHRGPGTERPGRRSPDGQRRRPAGEDPAARDRRRAAGRPQPFLGRRSRCVVSWCQHAVPGRGARRRHDHGLRAERRTCHEGRAVGSGGIGSAHMVAGPQLRRRRGAELGDGRHPLDGSDPGRSLHERVPAHHRPTDHPPPLRPGIGPGGLRDVPRGLRHGPAPQPRPRPPRRSRRRLPRRAAPPRRPARPPPRRPSRRCRPSSTGRTGPTTWTSTRRPASSRHSSSSRPSTGPRSTTRR